MDEQWKEIKGNREIYEVSNLGKFIFLKGELKCLE